ncbi:RICIN domain-containing protein [Marinoscillum sp. MHG1-6]|uniref:RICIN domain-containing protein n=1 Tax=Marinoscillum sp. MHG1-6 TaxID=2959627 RepID=UPI0021575CD2|nr:RICIN domain-containing protein [Marinoscillum sp. MHG1-6]
MNKLATQFFILINLILLVMAIESCDDERPQPEKVNDLIEKNDSLINQDTSIVDLDTTVVEEDSALLEETPTFISGTFALMSKRSGKALDVADWSTESGANIMQWVATDGDNQKWDISRDAGHYKIINKHSGLALSIENWSEEDGGNVVQFTYIRNSAQLWDIIEVEKGYYRIINVKGNKDLEVDNALPLDGANIQQWEYSESDHQQWILSDGTQGTANGQLSWTWVSEGVPADAYDRITQAMDTAVARYNQGAPWWNRTLTVEYNAGVATADASINGHIRFGPSSDFQNERTALHEIAHTYGVGTSGKWGTFLDGSAFTGENTLKLIKLYDGAEGGIWSDGTHFWPYGLNFNNEYTEENARRHVEIVSAMVIDGIF